MVENAMNIISLHEHLRTVMDEVSAKLREVSESQKETDKKFQETDKKFQETAEQIKETSEQIKETDKIVRRNSKQMGDLHRRFGELAEHLVAPNIHKRFNELGYHFGSYNQGGTRIFDERGNTKTEIDMVLENGSTIMALEVKAKPAVKDVEHHIKRLEILRDHRRSINDKRTIKGAIAGAIFGAEEKKATIEPGLYVVEQSGDTMKIDMPPCFVAREW